MSLNLEATDLPDISLQVLIKLLTFTEHLTLYVLTCVFSHHNCLVIDTLISTIIITSGCFPSISVDINFINDRKITTKSSNLVVPEQSCVCLNLDILDVPQVQIHLYVDLDDTFYGHSVTF